jgi:hypothetical protein
MPKPHIKYKIFLPVEAEISVTKVWTDWQTDGWTNGWTKWLQYSPLSTSGGITRNVCITKYARLYKLSNIMVKTSKYRYLSFYCKKWFYIWYVALAWWLVPWLPFQAYRTSTSCLPRVLEFFMFAVMKTFVTDISASTGRNDFIFDMWLWHGELYSVSPFQVYCTSTSCLPCDLEFFMFLQHFLVMSVEIYTNLTQMNEWGYS